jgi:hypothetical protein
MLADKTRRTWRSSLFLILDFRVGAKWVTLAFFTYVSHRVSGVIIDVHSLIKAWWSVSSFPRLSSFHTLFVLQI